MKGTPFHPRTSLLTREHLWFDWDGWFVPDAYEGVEEEVLAIRRLVTMCDMSPLSKYAIRGPDAVRLLDLLGTRDASKQDVGQVRYVPMCDDQGFVVSEVLAFRLAENEFRLSTDPIETWMREHAQGMHVEIDDITESFGILSVQGPKSADLLNALTGQQWTLPFSRLGWWRTRRSAVMIARQGFTGELGFELWVPAAQALDVWDAVVATGERLGARPAGEHAIEIARIEAGLLIVGADYAKAGPDRLGTKTQTSLSEQGTPFELGMHRFVDLSKSEFLGRAALARQAEHRSFRRRLVGLVVDYDALSRLADRFEAPTAIPRRVGYYPTTAFRRGEAVGRATSITWSPTRREVIAFGHLDPRVAVRDAEIELEWDIDGIQGRVRARVTDLPFVRIRRVSGRNGP